MGSGMGSGMGADFFANSTKEPDCTVSFTIPFPTAMPFRAIRSAWQPAADTMLSTTVLRSVSVCRKRVAMFAGGCEDAHPGTGLGVVVEDRT